MDRRRKLFLSLGVVLVTLAAGLPVRAATIPAPQTKNSGWLNCHSGKTFIILEFVGEFK
jgi:hypothetical protein